MKSIEIKWPITIVPRKWVKGGQRHSCAKVGNIYLAVLLGSVIKTLVSLSVFRRECHYFLAVTED